MGRGAVINVGKGDWRGASLGESSDSRPVHQKKKMGITLIVGCCHHSSAYIERMSDGRALPCGVKTRECR